jgi:hypothetical protein
MTHLRRLGTSFKATAAASAVAAVSSEACL